MLQLVRLNNLINGVQGVFLWNNRVVCHSLELPWLNNARDKSCIPVGTYKIFKEIHPRFMDVFRILSVPGRSGILIHPGNSVYDSRGCILPGLDVDDTITLKSSKPALQRLYNLVPTVSTLTILDGP